MSTTLRAGAGADQSRPTPIQETKNFGSLLRKLALKLAPRSANSVIVDENTSMAASTTSQAVNRKAHVSRSFRRRQTAASGHSNSSGLMHWLETDCPQELIPRVLAYAGPQTTAAVSLTCRFWKEIVERESTWRILCEELYKVCEQGRKMHLVLFGESDRFCRVIFSGRKETRCQIPGVTITSSIHASLLTFRRSAVPFRW